MARAPTVATSAVGKFTAGDQPRDLHVGRVTNLIKGFRFWTLGAEQLGDRQIDVATDGHVAELTGPKLVRAGILIQNRPADFGLTKATFSSSNEVAWEKVLLESEEDAGRCG